MSLIRKDGCDRKEDKEGVRKGEMEREREMESGWVKERGMTMR